MDGDVEFSELTYWVTVFGRDRGVFERFYTSLCQT